MVVLRCTGKVLRELRAYPRFAPIVGDESPDNAWFANLLQIERRKAVLFTHATTLYSFLVHGVVARDFQAFETLFSENLRRSLIDENFPMPIQSRLMLRWSDAVVAKTNSRVVLGCMNDLAYQIDAYVENPRFEPPLNTAHLGHHLRRTILSPIGYASPIDRFRAFASDVTI